MEMLRRYNVPEHIVQHSIQVACAGVWLSDNLKAGGLKIDREMVEAGCLLHDISKMYSIKKGGEHAMLGFKLLVKEGYAEVGDLVRQHVRLDMPVAEVSHINEAMVVNYADKRVRHHEIVTLEDRFVDLFERYALTEEKKRRMQLMYEETVLMEKMIFGFIGKGPDDLPFS